MNNVQKDPWDDIQLSPTEIKKNYDRSSNKDPWAELELEESWGKSVVRSLYQIPSGIGQAFTYPMDLIQLLGVADASDPEEIDRLKMISEREGIPFDEEKYFSALHKASQMFPTQGNIERIIEEETGAPLTAKTKFQKGIKLAATAGGFAPGSIAQKGVAAITAPTVSKGLQAMGVPEHLSDLSGLGISGVAAKLAPAATISKVTKPSGLPIRGYESLKKPTKVSENRFNKINEKIENDFRTITNDILEETPIEKTYKNLKEDASFKSTIADKFRDVEKLAADIPGEFTTAEIKNELMNSTTGRTEKGLTPSEYDVDYQKFMNDFQKKTPEKNISAVNLVDQYRKNNKSLGELYEPGKSRAYNRAKKEALLDYNKIIGDTIEKKYPDSAFSDLFKFTNKRWTEIKDAEYIDKFLDDMFTGKVNYEKGKKFFDKSAQEPFKRALGDQYPKFEQLMKDLMTTKQANSLLKIADQKGYKGFLKTGISYLIHPKLAATKIGLDNAKALYQTLLDKPKLTFVWDEGIKAAKKGEFDLAENNFSILDQEIKNTIKKDALKKFNERKNPSPESPKSNK